MPEPADRIVTVSTIKDTVKNAERLLTRNLSAGADHMIVFLDGNSPRVSELLRSTPNVTEIATARGYWHGARPERPSDRCRLNANLANAVLATMPSVRWLFHIDGDEALSIDRDDLLATGADVCRLQTLEALATVDPPHEEPPAFKRAPTEAELEALASAGVINRAHPWAYFRGHFEGKSGTRPSHTRRLGVHAVHDLSGEVLPAITLDSAHLLHYESWNYTDFVRRWKDYAPEQAHLRTHRGPRKQIGLRVYSILHNPKLSEGERSQRLHRMFANRVADDAVALEKAGLLVPPPARDLSPNALESADLEYLRTVLQALRRADKTGFEFDAPKDGPALALSRVADSLASSHPGIAARLSDFLSCSDVREPSANS